MSNVLVADSKAKNVSIIGYEAPSTFLSAMGRNSVKSMTCYKFGLEHFQKFIIKTYPAYNIETIIAPILARAINVYDVLEKFIAYLVALSLSPSSMKGYMAAVRSYLQYSDIDIIPAKFRRRVKMPKLYREDEEAMDASDIRNILQSCTSRRLKAYLLVLASGGMRAVEGFSIRLCDVNFTVNPTRIHLRKEYTKTKVARDIYISDEATQYLNQWIDFKYHNPDRKNKKPQRIRQETDLIFTVYQTAKPSVLYVRAIHEFHNLLDIVGMGSKKDGSKQQRRKITFHSLRRFVKTVISNQVNQDYSEWFLGHSKSPYYTTKELERRQIYSNKCMKYLTFLDYSTLETTGKNIEAQLSEQQKENQALKKRLDDLEEVYSNVKKMMYLEKENAELKKRFKSEPELSEGVSRQ
jgi:integrase